MRRTSLRVPPREARCRQHARRAPSAACTSPNARETRIVVSRRRAGSMEGEMWCGPLINDHATPRISLGVVIINQTRCRSASSTSHSRALTSPRNHGRAPPEPFTIIYERTSIAEAGLGLFLFLSCRCPCIAAFLARGYTLRRKARAHGAHLLDLLPREVALRYLVQRARATRHTSLRRAYHAQHLQPRGCSKRAGSPVGTKEAP